MKGTFFRSIWNLFPRVGFSKTSTAFALRASFWLDKKKTVLRPMHFNWQRDQETPFSNAKLVIVCNSMF